LKLDREPTAMDRAQPKRSAAGDCGSGRACAFALAAALLCAAAGAARAEEADAHFSYKIGATGNVAEFSIKGDIGSGAAQPGGTYHYSYPIEVPPGPRGTAPSVALVYTGEGSSWTGKGWSLGFGAVTRDTRKGVPPNFAGASVGDFLLNGTLLVKDGSRYRTEIESHQHITYVPGQNGGAWLVVSPDGTHSEYAEAVPALSLDGSVLGTREWLLTMVMDTAGNTLRYFYEWEPGSGTVKYPRRIVWGGAGGSFNAVRFETGSRADRRPSFATGSKVVEDRRLASIEVAYGTNATGAGGDVLRKYVLQHSYSASTGVLRLDSIQELGLDAATSPEERKTQFTYTSGGGNLTQPQEMGNAGQFVDEGAVLHTRILEFHNPGPLHDKYGTLAQRKNNVEVADINNDGIPEYIQGKGGAQGEEDSACEPQFCPPGAGDSKVWTLSQNLVWTPDASLNVPATFRHGSGPTEDYGARFLDVDGDGTQDLLFSYIGYRKVTSNYGSLGTYQGSVAWLNNLSPKGGAWTKDTELALPPGLRFSYYGQDSGVRIADVNGDGLPDIIHAYDARMSSVGGSYVSARTISGCYDSDARLQPPGVNEGRVYLMDRATKKWPSTPSLELPAGIFFVGPIPVDERRWRCPDLIGLSTCDGRMEQKATIEADLGVQIIDVNGDGLPDIVKATSYKYGCAPPEGCNVEECNASTYMGDPVAQNGVWLNTGQGWARYEETNAQGSTHDPWSTSLLSIAGIRLHARDTLCKVECGPDFVLLDYNDDGLPDIHDTRSGAWYMNNGRGWDATPKGSSNLTFDEGELYQDFTGDGRPDLLRSRCTEVVNDNQSGEREPLGCAATLQASSGTNPDLLKEVKSSMGGKLTLEYGHSSKWRTSHGAKLPQTRYVVVRVEADAAPQNPQLKARDPGSGAAGVSSTSYEYRQGEHNFTKREFRGFGQVRAKSTAGTGFDDVVTETHYHQDDARRGLVKKAVVRSLLNDPADATAVQIKEYEYTVTPEQLSAGEVFDRRLRWETERETPNGPVLKESHYTYDGFGNMLSKLEGGSKIAGPGRRTCWTYVPNESDWLLNYPHTIATYAVDEPNPQPCGSAQSTDSLESEVRYFYDGGDNGGSPMPTAGLVTRTESRNAFGSSVTTLETSAMYDGHGNKVSETDANGWSTTFVYDASRTYLTRIENALGHATSFEWHGVNASAADPRNEARIPGALQSFTDPNGFETFYSYDTFGRLTQVYRPLDEPGQPSLKHFYFDFGNVGQQRIRVDSRSGAGGSGYFTTVHVLDGFGRIVQSRSQAAPGWLLSTRQYDLLGRLWRRSVPEATELSGAGYQSQAISEQTQWSTTERDILGRPTWQGNIDGETERTYAYNGLRVTAKDELLKTKHLDYDSYGRLWQTVEVNDGVNHTTRYQYNVLDNLTRITEHGNVHTFYHHDSLGRRRQMEHPDRGAWSYSYDPAGNLLEQLDARGPEHALRFDYDALGRLVQKSAPGKLLARFYYDNAQPQHGDGGLGQQAAWFDWGLNEGHSFPELPSWVSGAAVTPGAVVDTAERSVTLPSSWAEDDGAFEHSFERSAVNGRLRLTVTLLDAPDMYCYIQLLDAAGQVLVDNFLNGNLASGTGRIVTREVTVDLDAPQHEDVSRIRLRRRYGELKVFHTALDRVTEPQQGGSPAELPPNRNYSVHSGAGRMSAGAVLASPGPFERAVSYRRDGVGHILREDASGLLALNLGFHDHAGLSLHAELRSADGSLLYWQSAELAGAGDGALRTLRMPVDLYFYPETRRVDVKVAAGHLELLHSSVTNFSGGSSGGGASPLYTAVDESPSGRQFSSFAVQNGIGRMTAYVDWTGQTAMSYDERGRLAAERKTLRGHDDGFHAYVSEHFYTPDDLPQGLLLPNDELLTYGYDTARRLRWLESTKPGAAPERVVFGAKYDSRSLLSEVEYGAGGRYVSSFEYRTPGGPGSRPDLRLNELRTLDKVSEGLLQGLTYEYDAVGNVTSIQDDTQSATQGYAGGLFGYDDQHRLVAATIGAQGPAPQTRSYAHSPIGNLTTIDDRTRQFGTDCLGPWPGRPHQLCQDGDLKLGYDAVGNLRTTERAGLPNVDFEYDEENRQIEAHNHTRGERITVDYDAQGRRVRRTLELGAEERTTYYPAPYYEKRPPEGEGTTSLYHAFGRLVAERVNTGQASEALRYTFADHLGSSSVIQNADGSTEWHTYWPYGLDYQRSNPENVHGYKYTGQEQDFAWLYNFKARAYLPAVGVFTQADTWEGDIYGPQTLNPYSYVLGNPLRYTDPTGRTPAGGYMPPAQGMGPIEFLSGAAWHGVAITHYSGGAAGIPDGEVTTEICYGRCEVSSPPRTSMHACHTGDMIACSIIGTPGINIPYLLTDLLIMSADPGPVRGDSINSGGPAEDAMFMAAGGAAGSFGRGRGAINLPQFSKSTIDDVIHSTRTLKGKTEKGMSLLMKRLASGDIRGVAATQANAEKIIINVLNNPLRSRWGSRFGQIEIVGKSFGQEIAVKINVETGMFIGFRAVDF
jgi:RHS repeat-associated protein